MPYPKPKTVNLPKLIRDHPRAVAIIDNDGWTLHARHPDQNPYRDGDNADDDAYEVWEKENLLADDSDIFEPRLGDGGYGSGGNYGGDILQALALIVGLRIESV